MNWFDASKEGLARLVADRPKMFIINELVQNAWDTNTSYVEIKLEKIPNSPRAIIEVADDDPDGFSKLTHAFTLFEDTKKRSDPTKRGRYTIGEKLVLAVCYEASISTTTGTVVFDDNGRHVRGHEKRSRGSIFRGVVRMTQQEYDQVLQEATTLIPPPNVRTTFNGKEIPARVPLGTTTATLSTVKADKQGLLRPTKRQTTVNVYEVLPGETASIYEMGIPVVHTGDRWHVEVCQRVPLNMNRDNVTPSYLRDIRTLVVNMMHDQLSEEQANSPLVNSTLGDENASAEAVEQALTLKYGKKRAIYDPSDPEANNNLVAKGYRLIYGPQLTSEQWKVAKRDGSLLPAGQIAPTNKAEFSPDGENNWIDPDDYTPGMKVVVEYAYDLATRLLGKGVRVGILKSPQQRWCACYGGDALAFNLAKLSKDFFETGISDELNQLLIHEFAHDTCSNHLDEDYHIACCKLGAKLARLALDEPTFFDRRDAAGCVEDLPKRRC